MAKDDTNKIEPVYHFSDNFNSAFFGGAAAQAKNPDNPASDAKLISNFIDLLTNPDKKALRSDALDTIRNAKAQQFLVDLIGMPDRVKHQRELVMACWETGLDFSSHLLFFCEVAAKSDYATALEAITVIDEMHGLTNSETTKKAVEILTSESLAPEKKSLVSETAERLSNLV